MNIQDKLNQYRHTIRDCETIIVVDSDGETILRSSADHVEDYDVQLFGAQMAVVLGNTVEDEHPEFVFMKNDEKSAAVKRLENGYFVGLSFDRLSFKGYAEKWLEDIAEAIREEFF